MNGGTVTQAEVLLRQAMARAEVRASVYLASMATSTDPAGDKADHECAVAGDIADAIDAIAPGLGLRFMAALHPELDLPSDDELAATALLVMPTAGRTQ